MNEAALANCIAGWLCCGSPVFWFIAGGLVYRHGGVRGALNYLLDRIGVPRPE